MRKRISNPTSLFLRTCMLLLLAACHDRPETPFDPEKALASFELAEGFQIEVVAHEPLIADPVAMEIDENGRMYVVQMHGYPLDKSGSGSIKLLSDTDGDGVMDQATVFADGLTLPNGIMRWKKGIIVTDAPHVLYLEDSDGDGKADIKDILLTGFALSNPQHKVNTPLYGIDNWIYLANEPITAAKIYVDEFGDTGSEIQYPGQSGSPVLPANANGRSVRFRPDQQGLEMLSSATQFSNTQDSWGRHFFGNNTNHLYHEVISARYLTRNPLLAVPSAIQTLSGYGMPADVYPITENAEHQIFTDAGVFTSACGITHYGGGLFPPDFDRVTFIGEPVSNLVHAAKLEPDGASFKANRMYEKREFLASKDAWFRPVNHYVGPDGALYVIDYHRRYIEHPEWMADDIVHSGALYDGKDKGRIYRISPVGTATPTWSQQLNLGQESSPELTRYLTHKNIWFRKNAQRLLVDRQDKSVVNLLVEIVENRNNPLGQLHAAWTLEGLGALTPDIVENLIRSAVPELRENGVLLAETLLEQYPEVAERLVSLKQDPDARVRFQLLCTLGFIDSPSFRQAREQLLFDNISDSWMQIAALSATEPGYEQLLEKAISRFSESNPAYIQVIERLVSMQAIQHKGTEALIDRALQTRDRHKGKWQAAILSGLARRKDNTNYAGSGFDPIKIKLLESATRHEYPAVQEASLNLLKVTGLPEGKQAEDVVAQSRKKIRDAGTDADSRLRAMSFLSIAKDKSSLPTFYSLISPKEPIAIQKAALHFLGENSGPEIATYLKEHWQELSPQLRDTAIGLFLKNDERVIVLLDALETDKIDPSSLDFYRQIYLMTLADETLRKRARLVFNDESKSEERKKAISQYKGILAKKGDPVNGAKVFEQNCAACHQIGGHYGTAFGPDLGTIRNRRAESILNDILDPALSIADGFDLWEITLINGQTRQGIISTETPTTVALSIYGSNPEVISRHEIQSIRALGVTIMPTGLESAISPSEMSDLLAFLKKP